MCRIVIDLVIIVVSIGALIAYLSERRKVKQELEHLRTQLAKCYGREPGAL
jgi:hypothetical protein